MNTTDAFIVDAVRTPMGRYRGVLAGVRPDDLAAHTIRAAVERTGLDPEAVRDVYWGAANQSGEDNRDAGRMASLLAGPARRGPRGHRQPPVRIRARGGQPGLAGAAPRRGRPVPRRGRRVHEPRAVGGPEARRRAAPRPPDDARHRARLAPDQPPDGRALLDGVDGRDGRERRREVRRQPRGAGSVRAPEPLARRGGDRAKAASPSR